MIAYWERDSEWMGDGLVGAWCPSFTGATGLQLADISGQANHGVLIGMDPGTDWVASGSGLALDFDGVNDATTLPIVNPLSSLQVPMTITAWCLKSSGANGSLFTQYSKITSHRLIKLAGYGTGEFSYYCSKSDGTYTRVAYSVVPTLGRLNFLTWTIDGSISSPIVRLGWDGREESFTPPALSSTPDTSVGIAIAANYAGQQSTSGPGVLGEYNAIRLDDIRVYNRALSPSEIQLLYTGGRGAGMLREPPRRRSFQGVTIPRPSSNPVRRKPRKNNTLLSGLVGAWCPSLGATGTRLLDVSGRNNHGVLTNMDANSDYIPSGGKLALDFDGSNDYVNVPIQFSGDKATFSCWINMRSYATYRPLGLFGRTPVTFSPSIGMQSGIDGNRLGYVWNNNDINTYNWNQGPIIPLNEWVLIALTVSPDRATVYLGSQSRRLTQVTNAISHLLQTVSSGFRISGDTYLDRSCDCQLDDVRIYNRALTNREINQLCIGGRGYGLKQQRIKVGFTDPSPNLNKISIRKPKKKNTLTTGLVGAWCPSLGPTGTRLRDVSGRNNDGVLTNMDPNTDWITSGGKGALDFDGVDDYVSAPINASYQFGSFSCCLWQRRTGNVTQNYPGVVTQTNNLGSGVLPGFGMFMGISSDPTVGNKTYVQIANNSTQISAVELIAGNDGIWNFYVGIVDRESGNISLYKNGRLQQQTSGVPAGTSITRSLDIGRRVDNTLGTVFRYATTQLDDIRIYNRALTPQEINQLYVGGRGYGLTPAKRTTSKKTIYVDAPVPAKPKPAVDTSKLKQGLVGAWIPSLGPTGLRLEDRSPYKNHGTLTNMDPNTDWVTSGGLGALDFDGTVSKSNEVLVATNSNKFALPTLGNKVTVCAWVFNRTYPSYSSVKRQILFIHGNRDTNNGAYYLGQGPTQKITFNFFQVSDYAATGTTTLPTNMWIFVCGTWDGQTAKVYYNGSQEGESAVSITPTASVANARIGRLGFSGFEYSVDGRIDDLRIYNRALTAQEVRALYLGGRGYGFRPQRERYVLGTETINTGGFKGAWYRRRPLMLGSGIQ
jgi:hypothetical protein